MIDLNIKKIPKPFGLQNTGSICYFNSLLQILATCTSIQQVIFLDKNEVEANFNMFIQQVKNNNVDDEISSMLIQSLHKLYPQFGNGQESASEAFTLLLNIINNPMLTKLFLNRFKYTVSCLSCNNSTDELADHALTINLFHTTELDIQNLIYQKILLDDYVCEKCSKKNSIRKCRLTMLSEIIFITFNIYHNKIKHEFPDILDFKESKLKYKLIGQIEHAGSLHGGHYWARALRHNDVFLFNDSFYYLSKFEPTVNTYIVLYHVF
jgi:ubiquitin carboxyl-terminal hydrolase 2/21